MKHRISISLDEQTLLDLKEYLRHSRLKFRSQSHLVDAAIEQFLKEKRGERE